MKKILVCDDDPGILEVTKIILENNGYEVVALETGKAIQKRVKKEKPDMILLDLWMPGIEGKEITYLLKRDPNTKNIPLIIVSAVNELDKIVSATSADGFLPKPFDMGDLLGIVEKYTKS